MKVLITGNMGYVGPVLTRHLRATIPGIRIVGFDSGFFAHCMTGAVSLPEIRVDEQHFGDVRDFPPELLDGIDAVVHLAAISNDPMGNKYESITDEVNFRASAEIARMAAARGVRHFVFASSCSMYGAASGGPRTETDTINPLTAYARSKAATEQELAKLANSPMVLTALRFATACGASDRLRLDLVLNDFVACALAQGEITVLSDGSPWRPLIDVQDMARAIEWAIQRDTVEGGVFLAINAGSDRWNYQVKDLADAVTRAIPGTKVSINKNAPPDKRSYQVDFSLFRKLAPGHQPRVSLEQSIDQIRSLLTGMRFADKSFRTSQFMRLKVLESHMENGRLGQDLRWRNGS